MSNRKITISFSPLTVLFLVFLILKLTETITWSWWWVFSPIWAPIAVLIGLIILVVVFLFLAWCGSIFFTSRRF